MKKLGAFLVGLGLVAGTVFAEATNTAVSVNIVGFSKITCPRDKFVLVGSAFESISGADLKCQDVFGDQLPVGTTVSYFDSGAVPPAYVSDTKTVRAWGTAITFKGWMGFWVNVPNTADSNSYDVVLSGQVPLALVSSNAVNTGYNLLGYPYTASVSWTNTALAQAAAVGDTIHVYDPNTGYTPYTLTVRGWGDARDLILTPGLGFWFQTSSAAYTNAEVRPYNP